jgi:Ca2+-binding RTX toxin-like protein
MGIWWPSSGPTAGNDSYSGTSASEVISSGAGDDVIYAGDGNDTIDGGDGWDVVFADAGNDIVLGGDGNDTVFGAEGNDQLSGGNGDDDLRGDAGDDTIDGGAGGDFIIGGSGSNTIHGGDGDDSLSAGDDYGWATAGLNRIFGDGGNDTILVRAQGPVGAHLSGGDGNDILGIAKPNGDTIDGGAGQDTIWIEGALGVPIGEPLIYDALIDLVAQRVTSDGRTLVFVSIESVFAGEGNDVVRGDASANWLVGNGGDDIIEGSLGNDVIVGDFGSGRPGTDALPGFLIDHYASDTVSYEHASGAVSVSLSYFFEGNGLAVGADGTDRLYLIDNVIGSAFDDVIVGASISGIRNELGIIEYGQNKLEGLAGNDFINGLYGRDLLLGGEGNDTLIGGDNADRLSGGAGDDLMEGGDGDDVLLAGEGGTDTLNGGEGFDTVSVESLGSVQFDMVIGGQLGAGIETWISIEGILGGALRDRFWGNSADNLLTGGGGDDDLFGRAGNDHLLGGDGNDVLQGGEGSDVLEAGNGSDVLDGSDGGDFISFAWRSSGVTFDLSLGTWSDAGATATFTSIEGIKGSKGDDLLTGDAGANTILGGGGGTDQLFGGDGDDWLDGQFVGASLYGGNGADMLIARNDTLIDGGAGDDVVDVSEGGQATLSGGEGRDTLIFHVSKYFSDQTITGFEVLGLANTELTIEQLAQFSVIYVAETFEGTLADLYIAGGGTINLSSQLGTHGIRVMGWTGADVIWTGDGNDLLRGGFARADDQLHGGGGNDTFIADWGNDLLDGGTGNDIVDYSEEDAGVTSSLLLGMGTDGNGDEDTFISIENLTGSRFSDTLTGNNETNVLRGDTTAYSEAGNDSLFGNGGNDALAGGSGDDHLDGGADADTLDGGEGNDTVSYATSLPGIVVSLDGSLTPTGDAVGDIYVSIENVTGSFFDDVIIGDNGDNILTGSFGRDILEGRLGANILIGGEGYDTASYAHATAGVTVSLAIVGAQNTIGAGTDTLVGMDFLTGSSFNDTLTGNADPNELDGGAGVDTMAGGAGSDTYLVDNAGDVVVELADAVDFDRVNSTVSYTLGLNAEMLALLGTANINGTGNFQDNIIEGNAGANILYGGSGADQLYGRDGNDRLDGANGDDVNYGGAGDDVYVVNSLFDILVEESPDGGVDTVQANLTYSLGRYIENLVLLGSDNLGGAGNYHANVMVGNAGANGFYGGLDNDTLYGNDGNDRLDGAAGDDILKGGFGDDIYVVDSIGDVVADEFNGGLDRVDTIVSYTLGSNVENLVLLGTASIGGSGNFLANILVGNSGNNGLFGGTGNDTLYGNDGNDRLDGSTGDDILKGGFGDDIYIVDSVGDVVTDEFNGGLDRVDASVSYTLGSNVENLVLAGTANINGTGNFLANTMVGNSGANSLYGGTGDDVLFGNDGNDRLDGATGNDTMKGGLGDDIYIVDSISDTTTEDINQGTDRIDAFVSYTIGVNIENMVLQGTGNINGTGNFVNNTIIGNGGDNILFGAGGNDTLLGGAGNDQLDGSVGNDRLTGGAGADKFVFATALNATGVDQILDFNAAEDVIWLDDAVFTAIGTGVLAASAFTTGSAAADAVDRIIYDPTTGALYYDADGSGGGAAVQIATLSTGLAMTADQFGGI